MPSVTAWMTVLDFVARGNRSGLFIWIDAGGPFPTPTLYCEFGRSLSRPLGRTFGSLRAQINISKRPATTHEGRKQYRYHPKWREQRDASKYKHLAEFIEVLPRIRRRVSRDLARHGLPREKILAAIVRLLEKSLIRIGNGDYARDNRSYGLTTMQNRHAKVRGERLQFHFRGKSGKVHDIEVESETLARIVRKCQDLPGQKLFEYIDEQGKIRSLESDDVNSYLRGISGRSGQGLSQLGRAPRWQPGRSRNVEFDSESQAKRNIRQAVERVAAQLGNTAATCRKCYIHPAVFTGLFEIARSRGD